MKAFLVRFFEAHPRLRGILTAAIPLGVWALDVQRLGIARDDLGDEWSGGIRWGIVLAVGLVALAVGAWFLHRRFPAAGPATSVVGVIVAVGLVGLTHPRRGDDGIRSEADVALLVGFDVAVGIVLLGLAGWAFRRRSDRR